MNCDAGAGVLAEVLDLVGSAVAVLVAQRRDAALRLGLAQGDVDVAIIAHRDVARAPDTLGEHLGVEPLGYSNTGVLVHRRMLAECQLVRLAERRADAQGERTEDEARPKAAPAYAARHPVRRSASRVPIVDHDPPAAR